MSLAITKHAVVEVEFLTEMNAAVYLDHPPYAMLPQSMSYTFRKIVSRPAGRPLMTHEKTRLACWLLQLDIYEP
jgi:hypothetical protein